MEVQSKSIKSQFIILASIVVMALVISHNTLNANVQSVSDQEITNDFENDNYQYVPVQHENSFKASSVNFSKGNFEHIDTIPSGSKSVTKIIQKNDDEEVELEIEDGEVTKLKIDGKEVPASEYENHEKIIRKYKDGGNVFYFGDGNAKVHSFEFPEIDGDAFSFSFGGKDFDFNSQHRLLIDSMLQGRFNDSVFVFPFGGEMNMNGFGDMEWDRFPEEFRLESFPEGFDMDRFLNRFEFQHEELGEELEELERMLESEHFRNESRPFLKDKGYDFQFKKEERNLENIIGNQLNKDGFLIPNKENTILLTGKYLKINGEKQPSNIWNKYKSLFETETGVPLHRKSRLEFSIIGKESNKRYKAF